MDSVRRRGGGADELLEFAGLRSPTESRRLWRQYTSGDWPEDLKPIRIGLVASFNADPLVAHWGTYLVDRGFRPEFYVAPYGQVFQQCLGDGSGVRLARPDLTLLLWRMEDLLQAQLGKGAVDSADALTETEDEARRLAGAAIQLAGGTGAVVLLAVPAPPRIRHQGFGDLSNPAGVSALHRKASETLLNEFRDSRQVFPFDLDSVQREVGFRAGESPKMYLLAKIAWTEEMFNAVGQRAAAATEALFAPSRKCLVLDCDGTLWGGIVGEDGTGGVSIGEDSPGNAYREFQKYVLTIRDQGIVLALCSKNNERDVWEVFERRDMPLRRDHLAAWRINWEAKSANLAEIASELNIGLDSLVLLDDSPVEVAEVRANAPQVKAILLPTEWPERYVDLLSAADLFPRISITAEDRRRSDMYAEQKERDDFREATGSLEGFLQGLRIRVRIERPSKFDLPRIAQLVNKTNQFNLTTHRRSEAEVTMDWKDPSCSEYAVWVSDRFGEYGLTGYALVTGYPDSPELDTFLLSCRVMARGIETAMLARILEDIGDRDLRARHIPGDKNQVTATFLSDNGFVETSEGHYLSDSTEIVATPHHIQIVGRAERVQVR